MEEKRIIDINGMKMEVDLRTAKRIDTFKVGDNVKVLATEYNGTWGDYRFCDVQGSSYYCSCSF